MDCRQFSVLLMAVFLAIVAPIANAQGSETNTTMEKSATSAVPASITTAVNTTSPDNKIASSTETPSSTRSEVAVNQTVPSSTLSSTTTVATTTVTASTVNANSSVTNDQAIRDVSSDLDKCSTSFETTHEKEKDNWVPEKVLFHGVSGEDSTLTIEKFCLQLQTIIKLNALCNNTKTAMDAEDLKVAPIVAGLASMFTAICSEGKNQLNVTAGDSTPCVEFIRVTAKSCSSNPIAKAVHVYPTQVLFDEMTHDNCTVVFNTKDCITKALKDDDKCSAAQRTVISDAMTKMTKGLPCVVATNPAPSITTPKTPGNAGTNFQVNFLAILPFVVMAVKFY